jgi:hypothetical protein
MSRRTEYMEKKQMTRKYESNGKLSQDAPLAGGKQYGKMETNARADMSTKSAK